jgi:hypothetical protein
VRLGYQRKEAFSIEFFGLEQAEEAGAGSRSRSRL